MSQMASNILYYADSAPVTQKDIENALADAGIKKGDTIMVHSDIGSFGKLGTLDREFLLQSLVKSLKNTIGPDGTIIMPTFTYSFNKHEPYDIKNTKSTVGTLTEYFRKQKDVSRTAHPTHSAAIWGKHKKELLNIGKGTFDKSSIFGKFHQMNGKFVSFGVPLHMSCTFIHYIEHIHKVPYRYIKKIKGKIITGNKKYEEEISFDNRYAVFFASFLKFEKYLLKEKLLKEVKVGKSIISMIESDVLLKEGCKLLDNDIYFFVRNDKIIFKIINYSLYFFLQYFPWPFRMLNEAGSIFFCWLRRNNVED